MKRKPKRSPNAEAKALRKFVFNRMADPETPNGQVFVENMDMILKWIQSGKVPGRPKLTLAAVNKP